MKNLFVTLLMLIFISNVSTAQVTFQKTYNSSNTDGSNFIQQTSDDGYINAGFATDVVLGLNQDAHLIKTDADGAVVWSKTYGNTDNEVAHCAQQTTDGGYIFAGISQVGSQHHGFLIRTNSAGDTIWTKTYGSTIKFIYTVRQTSDGGYILGGTTSGSFGPSAVIKVDNLGNVLWAKSYGNGQSADDLLFVAEVQQTTDGGYIVGGNRSCGNCPMFLVKLNSAGDTLWTKIYGPNLYGGNSLQQTSDGGFIIGGLYNPGGNTNDGAAFIKTDPDGNVVWYKVYPLNNFGTVKSVRQTSNGEYIALLQNASVYALKMNSSGNRLWCVKYEPTASMEFMSVQQTNDDGFVFTGQGPQSGSDVILIKSDANGLSGCNEVSFIINSTSPSIEVVSAFSPITSLSLTSSPMSLIEVNTTSTVETPLCTTVGINPFSNNTNGITIYPNPFANQTTLTFEYSKQSHYFLTIQTLTGQVVRSTNNIRTGKFIIDRGDLVSGIYFYQLSADNQQIASGKIVVN